MVTHAEPKPAPDYGRFDLDTVVEAAIHPWNPAVMERAANSLRCIEAAHGGLSQKVEDGRFLVPDSLFSAGVARAGMVQAAQTTTGTAAGLVDEVLQPGFIGFLTGGGELLPYLSVRSGLASPVAVPRVAGAVSPTPAAEGENRSATLVAFEGGAGEGAVATATVSAAGVITAIAVTAGGMGYTSVPNVVITGSGMGAAATATVVGEAVTAVAVDDGGTGYGRLLPVTFTYDQVEFTPKVLRAAWDYTPELNLSARRRIGVEGVEEVRRQFAHQIETQLWTGSGMNGQVQGLEARLTMARRTSYPRGAWNRDHAWLLMDALNGNLLDRQGRVFVATREMSKQLVTVGWDKEQRSMWGVPLVDTVRPSEDGAGANVTGRLWLLQGRDVIVGLYGDDIEVIVDREQKTGNHQVTCLRQWDLNLRHTTSHQVLVAQ